jgi:hypothetical protein
MAISTYGVRLMQKLEGASWGMLVDIKDFPDLGGAPEMLETTTLGNSMQTYIPGIQALDALEFTANYDFLDYKKVKALEGKEIDLAVWFGELGENGKFEFKGYVSAFPVGGGVNAVVDMKISVAPSTPIVLGE